MEKKLNIKEISGIFKTRKTTISQTLKDMGVNVSPMYHSTHKLKLGFHLHHRLKISFTKSVALSKVSVNSLRKFFQEKKVRIRYSGYEKLSADQKKLHDEMWSCNNYSPINAFSIAKKHNNVISVKMGDSIISLYENGASIQEMNKKTLIPLSQATISEFLKYNQRDIKQGEDYARLYTVNKNFFSVIDTEEKAYWLGFIMGDGCVHGDDNRENWTLSVGLKRKDEHHLVKLLNSLQATNKISRYLVNNQYPTSSISISNTKLCKDLESLGVVRRKSLVATFPTKVPIELRLHFIRGLFDADGSIPKSSGKVVGFSICGTPLLMASILEMLDINNKYLYIRKDLNNFGEIRCNKRTEAIRVLSELYNNATIYLPRKYNRYLELRNQIAN